MTRSAMRSLLLGAAALWVGSPAHAESLASSASSAGSASSGSVSTSFKGSSDSSTGNRKTADGDYRIVEVAAVDEAAAGDGRAALTRLTLQAADPDQRIVLDLPRAIVEAQQLVDGVTVRARQRDYGFEFSRADSREAFYLVLADDWFDGLAARQVRL